MNVFVLNTGRVGSITFFKACTRITNYTAAHESRARILGKDRLDYPDNHIEVDNRLSWFLGRLDDKYGDDAYYVHLLRNDEKVINSFAKRHKSGILSIYRKGIHWNLQNDPTKFELAEDYCFTVNSNIRHFLKDKSNKMEIYLETVKEQFPTFCEWIGADLDMEDALDALNRRHFAYVIKEGDKWQKKPELRFI